MKDRVPLHPGRVQLTPVPGQENTFDLVRADQPTQEGTPLNKANLLKDDTAALFGMGTDAVPDDVLVYLGKYAEYWWKRYAVTPATYTLIPPPDTSSNYWLYIYRNNSIEWANEVSVSSDGVVSLVNPTTTTAESIRTNTTSWRGRFVKGTFKIGSLNAGGTNLIIRFTSQLLSVSMNDSHVTFSTRDYEKVEGVPATESDVFDYVRSVNRNAYPDNGVIGTYKYEYIGVPFDNAVGAPKIATGSYTGTGTYGASNPNSLTFAFAPKLVYIYKTTGNYTYQMLCGVGAVRTPTVYAGDSGTASLSRYSSVVNLNGNQLTWYDYQSASPQLNEAGETYNYIAIG